MRRDRTGDAQQRLKRGHRGLPAIGAKDELIKIPGKIFGFNAVMGPRQPSLEIAASAMDVDGQRQAGMMPVTRQGGFGVAAPASGGKQRPGFDVGRQETLDGAFIGSVGFAQPQSPGSLGVPAAGIDILQHRDRTEDERLVGRRGDATGVFALGRATDEGFIHLDPAAQRGALAAEPWPGAVDGAKTRQSCSDSSSAVGVGAHSIPGCACLSNRLPKTNPAPGSGCDAARSQRWAKVGARNLGIGKAVVS